MINIPCYQCQDRRPGCHNPEVCSRWAAYEAEAAVHRTAVRQATDRAAVGAGYVREQRTKLDRRKANDRRRGRR